MKNTNVETGLRIFKVSELSETLYQTVKLAFDSLSDWDKVVLKDGMPVGILICEDWSIDRFSYFSLV